VVAAASASLNPPRDEGRALLPAQERPSPDETLAARFAAWLPAMLRRDAHPKQQ
jgi:hypothetical protein